MANPDHLKILGTGAAAWHEWRRRNQDVRPDLRSADLYVGHLTRLRDAIVSRARLCYESDQDNVDWNKVDEEVDRQIDYAEGLLAPDGFGFPGVGADLLGVDFSSADLAGCDLTRANLSYADLTGADLSSASLFEATLSLAVLDRANLSGADLGGRFQLAVPKHHQIWSQHPIRRGTADGRLQMNNLEICRAPTP